MTGVPNLQSVMHLAASVIRVGPVPRLFVSRVGIVGMIEAIPRIGRGKRLAVSVFRVRRPCKIVSICNQVRRVLAGILRGDAMVHR